MKTLVIGGTGWVGHHIAHKLAKRGHEVIVLSRGTKGRFPPPENCATIRADKNQPESFRGLLSGLDADVVIDSAPSERCLGVLVEVMTGRIRHYLHCSSTGVYTPLRFIPATEEHPWREPTGINFMRKVELDAAALDAWQRVNFPATILRPTNIMGPGMAPIDTLGGRDPNFLSDVAAGKEVFLPNDGRALLQPVFVEDVAEAFALAVERPESIGRIYNISCRHSVTLREYLSTVCSILGAAPEATCLTAEELLSRFEHTGRVSPAGLRFLCEHMCFDISRARKELGYEPTLSIEEATRRTIEWWRAGRGEARR